jgi:antitoxin component YwqK of YwqJK toxin-antitoxin module
MQFVAGKKHGATVRWHASGAKELEGSYKDGKKDGTFSYYTEEGELSKTEQYSSGRLVTTKKHPTKKPQAVADRH